jgi:glycosyltransferase involved in cell wall biosynthesis
MNILLIGPFPPPIQGNSFANQILYNNLQSRDFTCNIVNTTSQSISSKQGNTFSIRKAINFLTNYLKIYKLLSTDIVYITPGQTFFGVIKYAPFILFCILLKKKYVLHLHGNDLRNEYYLQSKIKKKILYFLISRASVGIVLSNSLIRNFQPFMNSEKIVVIKNFVENIFYKRDIKKNTDCLRILYLSNLMKEKGIIEILDALLILKDKNIKFIANFAGAIEETIKEEVLLKIDLLKNFASYDGVITGDEKVNAFSEANVFILPTYYKKEGQPISLLEALASGNVIITTKHSGIPDIIDERNGFFVEKKSVESIVKCLEHVNDNLKNIVNQISLKNREYAIQGFTEKVFIDNFIRVLEFIQQK